MWKLWSFCAGLIYLMICGCPKGTVSNLAAVTASPIVAHCESHYHADKNASLDKTIHGWCCNPNGCGGNPDACNEKCGFSFAKSLRLGQQAASNAELKNNAPTCVFPPRYSSQTPSSTCAELPLAACRTYDKNNSDVTETGDPTGGNLNYRWDCSQDYNAYYMTWWSPFTYQNYSWEKYPISLSESDWNAIAKASLNVNVSNCLISQYTKTHPAKDKNYLLLNPFCRLPAVDPPVPPMAHCEPFSPDGGAVIYTAVAENSSSRSIPTTLMFYRWCCFGSCGHLRAGTNFNNNCRASSATSFYRGVICPTPTLAQDPKFN